jgi:alkanesulfonate monooxygenase SsuD/methylene tetrahydromethanopterin reductase-like flavin-dependent oxidoreductase (luciferase family)
VATLDLLSGGRVELGLGEGQGPVELHPFGARVREKREVWEEAVRALVPAFTTQRHEWKGQQTIADAGRWGMGALGFQFVSAAAARAWVNRYYIELTQHQAKLADYPANPNIAMVSGFMCAETDEEALEKAGGWTFFVFCLSHYGRHGIANPGEGNMWEAYQEWRQTDKAQETLRSGLIGSPETIRRCLRELEATGVDQVILLNQAGRTTHEDICKSLEIFARDVMPEFHAREPEHAQWKADVLGGRIAIADEGADTYKLYAHQNEDIVRLTPAELKAKMAAKERAGAGGS